MSNKEDDGERIEPSASTRTTDGFQHNLHSYAVDSVMSFESGSGHALSCQSPAYGSYVSSSASSGNDAHEEQRMTIGDLATNSAELSETMPQHSQLISFYDSEESDGSIILSYSNAAANYDSSPREQLQRNRLPSFDSAASTGSFQRLPATSGNRNSPNYANAISSKPVAVLPYDQRRKLSLKQKEQQPTPLLPNVQDMQPVYSNSTQQQAQHFVGYTTTENETNYWLPPPQHDQQYQQYQNYASYQLTHSQGHQMMQHRPPSGYRPGQEKSNYPKSERGRNFVSKPSQSSFKNYQPYSSNLMYQVGQHRDGFQISPGTRGRTSSVDSSSSQENERALRYAIKSKDPPPPPPPMPAHNNIQASSSGSLSSLGSLTDKLDSEIFGFIKHEKNENVTNKNTNFVEGIVSYLSPRQRRSHERKYSIEEFHEKNQEFLKKAKRQQNSPQQPQHSPKVLRPSLRSNTPPRSRGSHQTLSSIENDVWEEQADQTERTSRRSRNSNYATIRSDVLSSSERSESDPDPDERTTLLPPSGISSREKAKEPRERDRRKQKSLKDVDRSNHYSDRNFRRLERSSQRNHGGDIRSSKRGTTTNNSNAKRHTKQRRKSRKEQRKRNRRSRQRSDSDNSDSTEDSISSSSESIDYRQWILARTKMLEKERAKLIAQWKAEAQAEAQADAAKARAVEEENRWYRKANRAIKRLFQAHAGKAFRYLALLETFISNLPSTIGAVALAIVTLGVVWFKYTEENLDSCEPVHFHSSQCSFPEFPGCFFCDTNARMYKVAVNFHFTCSAIAGVLAIAFMLKIFLATRVVLDELSSPTTASPAGLICMTTVCVFAGRGWIGQLLVSAAAGVHFCLAIWFIYCALAYHIMPDPSWFPNTVGIGLSAVKAWLYYPMTGHFLMAICLALLFFFFPISMIRVTLNEKISAPVGWIQMSAPSIALYALTIMAQPSFEEEHPDVTKFERVHRMVYLPCMHFLFGLAVFGVISSAQSLIARWESFKRKGFSPAHAAFCFPTLAHANAIQAYRAALNSFSDTESGTPFKVAIYVYWVIFLVSGTIATVYVTWKFFYMLPSWTQIDVIDEVEPPAPYETTLTLHNAITTGETLRQPFVSPAVLQANETGALIMLPRTAGGNRYVRTRRLPALGFEPTMEWSELSKERDVLLDWVGKNPPRRRKRTLSVPGIDFNYGYGNFGLGNSGVYGSVPREDTYHHRSSSSTAADGRHDISWQNH